MYVCICVHVHVRGCMKDRERERERERERSGVVFHFERHFVSVSCYTFGSFKYKMELLF